MNLLYPRQITEHQLHYFIGVALPASQQYDSDAIIYYYLFFSSFTDQIQVPGENHSIIHQGNLGKPLSICYAEIA